jgi:hypothetical protein
MPAVKRRFPTVRPNVVENGSDVVTFPFPTLKVGGNVAISPGGTAYFLGGLDGDEVDSVSPSGQLSTYIEPHAAAGGTPYDILYARGDLWTLGGSGIVEMNPDGTGHRWYALSLNGGTLAHSLGIVYGRDGAIYTVISYNFYTSSPSYWLYRIDTHGNVTGVHIPLGSGTLAVSNFVAGPNGEFYLGYQLGSGGAVGIATFNFDGALSLFPVVYEGATAQIIGALAYSNGSLYFLYNIYEGRYAYLARLSSGELTTYALPNSTNFSYNVYYNLSSDLGGNIWFAEYERGDYSDRDFLYQFNVSTGRFNEQYELASGSEIGTGISVGPDDNIWYLANYEGNYVSGLAVFVRHVQTLEPSTISVAPAKSSQFTILETHTNGPWTAVSQNPAVATVSPARSTTGAFTVSDVRAGTTQILVKDTLGNVSYETVTAQ